MRSEVRCEHGFRKPCTVCDPFVCSRLDPSETSTPGQWEMPSEPDAIVFVIAPNHLWFENWCLIDNHPPLNPKDRRWRVLTHREDALRLVKGRHWREGDKILEIGHPSWRGLHEVLRYALLPAGFTEIETPDGRKFPL